MKYQLTPLTSTTRSEINTGCKRHIGEINKIKGFGIFQINSLLDLTRSTHSFFSSRQGKCDTGFKVEIMCDIMTYGVMYLLKMFKRSGMRILKE